MPGLEVNARYSKKEQLESKLEVTIMKKQSFLQLFVVFAISFFFQATAQDPLPESVDLSATKYFPPIYDQGYIGSCDWFAVVYYQMTFLYNKAYDRADSLRNTFSPKFGYNILNNGASYPYNIRVDDVYRFSIKHGSATMADFPYDMDYRPWCTDAAIWQNAINYRIGGYTHFTYNNTDSSADYSFLDYNSYFNEIKKLLDSGEVLVIQSNTFSGSLYKEISDDTSTHADDPFVGEQIIYSGNNGPDHTLAVVGYNDNIWVDLNNDGIVQPNEKGALKIADSYNSASHNKGFLWMAYSTVGSSIWLYRVNRMTIRKNYHPRILCKLTLISAQRDNIRFQFGRNPSNNINAVPANNPEVFDPYGLGYGLGTNGVSLMPGGYCAFDGGSSSSECSFSFDLSDIFKDNKQDYWYLRIENSGADSCIIKDFEIIDLTTGDTAKDNGLPKTIVNEETIRFLDFQNSSTVKSSFASKDGKKNLQMYLNPVSSNLICDVSQDLIGGSVKIFNLNGKLLLKYNILSANKSIIPMSNFPCGYYAVLLTNKNCSIRQIARIAKM
jgi:hypothetical protein